MSNFHSLVVQQFEPIYRLKHSKSHSNAREYLSVFFLDSIKNWLQQSVFTLVKTQRNSQNV